MAIVVGQTVRGENFWDRETELEAIWDAIDAGSHILLSAPRRVGKTSIMYKLLDEPKSNYIVMYIDTEAADSEREFWKKLFNRLLHEDFVSTLNVKARQLWEILKGIKITKVTEAGVEFGDGEVLDYSEAFKSLIKNLDSDKKLIVMLDEFAQTIENIIKYENEKSALSLLKTHRELRQDEEFSKKVTFVYAGSIGLESVVDKMGGARHINDLNSIKVKPLAYDNAKAFTLHLAHSNNLVIQEPEIDYLLGKVEWLIPFYIQLIAQEIKTLFRVQPSVTSEMIDEAINSALEHRNYFDSWHNKIKEAFKGHEFLFAKEVLNNISENMTIGSSDISNIAAKHSVEADSAQGTIRSLVYDGYINNNDNHKVYRFNSPILRMWWNKNVAN